MSYDTPSGYESSQTPGTIASVFKWPTNAVALQLQVTHATQTIKVGQGSETTAGDNASARVFSNDINDGLVKVGKVPGATHFALLGSGATTGVNIGIL